MVKYLTDKEVIIINAMVIKKYSPRELMGIKDQALFESAIYRPKQTIFGDDAYQDIWTKAAALFASLAQNHAFHNANKRTAFSSTFMFLRKNGYQLKMDQDFAVEYTVHVVNDKPEIEEIAKVLKEHC